MFYSLMWPGSRLQLERLPIEQVYLQYVSSMDIQSSIWVDVFDVSGCLCCFGIPCMCGASHVCTSSRVVTDGKGLIQRGLVWREPLLLPPGGLCWGACVHGQLFHDWSILVLMPIAETQGTLQCQCWGAVRLMKMSHQGLFLWAADSSCSHGTEWPQMLPRDSRNIFHIPALICSGSSADDSFLILPFFPTPWAMGYPIEMMEYIGMVDTI